MRDMLRWSGTPRTPVWSVETGLPAVLSGALHQRSLMGTIVVVAALQLVLLAIWVLASVLMRSADLRRAELRVARLRGFPPPTLLAVLIMEPAALCAIGACWASPALGAPCVVAASILFAPATTVGLDSVDVRRLRSGGADDLRRSGSQRDAVAARLLAWAASVPAVRAAGVHES